MTTRGRLPKPASRRPGQHDDRVVEFAPRQNAEIPEPARHWLRVTQADWRDYWASPVAELVDRASDMPALLRLFSMRDERERCYRGIGTMRVVPGSRGQATANPLWRVASVLDTEIRQLEDRFGLSPLGRLRLGVELGRARDAWAAVTDVGDTDADTDPRLDAS